MTSEATNDIPIVLLNKNIEKNGEIGSSKTRSQKGNRKGNPNPNLPSKITPPKSVKTHSSGENDDEKQKSTLPKRAAHVQASLKITECYRKK